MFENKRTEVIFDDARHFIATTREKFDIITSDPIHPWVRGAAALYSVEYFELCKKRLNPGGIVTQWIPLYETNMEAAKSSIASFVEVFPYTTIWGNELDGEGYDIVLMGHLSKPKLDLGVLLERYQSREFTMVALAMEEVNFRNVFDIFDTYAGSGDDIEEWLADAKVNRDSNLKLQFLAGMGINQYEAGSIYSEIFRRARFPKSLLVGNNPMAKLIESSFEQRRKDFGVE